MTASAKSLFRAMRPKVRQDAVPTLDMDLPEQRREAEKRRAHDAYMTAQVEPIRALLAADGQRIRDLGSVWEPACGEGHLVREIRSFGVPCCASDLIDRGCPDSWQADFFTCFRSRGRAIITNPPYDQINARDGHGRWLRHTLAMPDWHYCALLLSWDWPAARQNGLGDLLDESPFSYCYLMRWKIDFSGEGSPPQRNAWFVWVRGWDQVPMQMRFLNREMDWRQGAML
jgi:hypothetical protein